MNQQNIFRRSIKPLTIVSSIFGVFPISFNEKKPTKVSPLKILYSFGFVTVISSYGFYYILASTPKGGELQSYIFKFYGIVYPCIMCFYFFSHLLRAESLSKLLKITLIFSTFVKDERFYTKVFWTSIGEIVLLVLLMTSYYVLLHLSDPDHYNQTNLSLWHMTILLMEISLGLINFQHSNLMLFLGKVLLNLNSDLKILGFHRIFNIRDEYSAVLDELKGRCSNNLKLVNGRTDLEFWIFLHEHFCKLCEDVDSTFGPSAGARAAHTLIQITVTIYSVLVGVENFFTGIIILIRHVLELWLLIFSCERVVKEVR